MTAVMIKAAEIRVGHVITRGLGRGYDGRETVVLAVAQEKAPSGATMLSVKTGAFWTVLHPDGVVEVLS